MIPNGLGTAMTAIGKSGASGTERAVLVWLLHDGDWQNVNAGTAMAAWQLADMSGHAESTITATLKTLTLAGVIVETPDRGRAVRRRIAWSALETYSTAPTKRGGIQAKANTKHRTSVVQTEIETPNIGGLIHRTSVDETPNIGGQNTELRCPIVSSVSSPPLLLPEVEAIRPADAKPKKPTKPKPDHAADLLSVLEAFALIDPKRAAKAIGGTNAGITTAATSAIKAKGAAVVAARLRYVAANPNDGGVLFWRRNGSKPLSLFVHDGPMVNAWDDAAAMATDAPATDSIGARVWAEILALPAWQRFAPLRPSPNRPDRHGESTGFDLHPDREEHARRWEAYLRAGGARAWFDASTPEAEHAFGSNFAAGYLPARAIEVSA